MGNIIPPKPQPAIIEQKILNWEELVSEGMVARENKDGSQWRLGDLALMIEKKYREDSLGKFAVEIGVRKNSLKNYRNTARIFKKDIRISFSRLSYSHFQICASQENPKKWLEDADENNWSCEYLSREIAKQKEKKRYTIEGFKTSFQNMVIRLLREKISDEKLIIIRDWVQKRFIERVNKILGDSVGKKDNII